MKGTKEVQEKLIDLVERERILWDPRNKNHVNKRALDTRWEEIGGIIGVSGKEASRMWRSLRHEFKKQLDKEETRAEDGASSESFESTWPLFNRLLFLKEKGRYVKTESVPHVICISDDSENDEPLSQNEAALSSSLDITVAIPVKRMKILNVDTEQAKVRREKDKSESRIPLPGYCVDDDATCFFNSLLPHVRNLPLQKQLEFRVETQRILYDLTFPTNVEIEQEDQQPTTSNQTDTNIY